jgi:hypothetical protein
MMFDRFLLCPIFLSLFVLIILSHSFLLSDTRVYKCLFCMKTVRFSIRRNIIKRSFISVDSSSIKNRHNYHLSLFAHLVRDYIRTQIACMKPNDQDNSTWRIVYISGFESD